MSPHGRQAPETVLQPAAAAKVVLALVCFSVVLAGFGCAPRAPLYAQPQTLAGGLHVKIKEAFVRSERVSVLAYLINASAGVIRIDRDGLGLRLPDGRVLAREIDPEDRAIYSLRPGEGRAVRLDFRAAGSLQRLPGCTLIVGGIGYGTDVHERIAGEILLTRQRPPPLLVVVPPAPAPPTQALAAPVVAPSAPPVAPALSAAVPPAPVPTATATPPPSPEPEPDNPFAYP